MFETDFNLYLRLGAVVQVLTCLAGSSAPDEPAVLGLSEPELRARYDVTGANAITE